jgi:hypothetical protein
MPSTYTLISSNILSSSTASVTFSSVPATYTDLLLKVSARTNNGFNRNYLVLTMNGVGGTSYSIIRLTNDSGTPTSASMSNEASIQEFPANGGSSAANTFSNIDIYIPSYTASQNKQIAISSAQENTSTSIDITDTAALFKNNSTITTLTIQPNTANDFVSGSSFYLYGIKNS